jgi:GTP-binding protein YchF
MLQDLHLITLKPIMLVVNVSEDEVATLDVEKLRAEIGAPASTKIIPISAKVESELVGFSEEEAQEFLDALGMKETGLHQLIREAYDLLNLQTYFTAGVTEVRAWTIHKGDKAPQAAGVIHTDFEKGFIRAEVIAYQDYIACGGETGAKEKGKARTEGKDYVVQDGDVMHFRFN